MFDLKACRCCLDTKGKLERIGEAYIRLYTAVTGLEIQERDGYPTYVCLECSTQMKRALAFRRKCRRAHYVLKEIMAVRKQVRYNDILMVDRKRTNLCSLFNFWRPQNAGFYTISTPDVYETDDFQNAKPELQTEEEKNEYSLDISYDPSKTCQYKLEIKHDIKPAQYANTKFNEINSEYTKNTNNVANGNTEMTKYIPESNHTATLIVTDIKPANYKEIEREEEERRLEEMKMEGEEMDNQNDYVDDENDGIDLDDVFKDLKEESEVEEENYEEEVELPPIKPVEKKIKKKTTGIVMFHKGEIFEMCKALANAEIRSLSEEEQVEWFQKRLTSDPYKSAFYKCGVCLIVFSDMTELLSHVQSHNSNIGEFVCHICKHMFKRPELLEVHIAHKHRYEFTCKKCHSKWNTLDSLVLCSSRHKQDHIQKPKSRPRVSMIQKWYRTSLLRPEQLSRTLEKYSGYLNGYSCEKCNIGFIDLYTLSRHLDSHKMPKPVGPYDYQCDICQCWFRNMKNLRNHMEAWHTYSYECRICYVTLMNKEQAVHHKNGHISQGDIIPYKACIAKGVKKPASKYECKFCRKILKSATALNAHHNSSHYNDMRPAHCQLCGYPCTKQYSLFKHQLREHNHIYYMEPSSPELKFTCATCHSKFVDEKAYHVHLVKMAHEKDKRIELSCRVCRKQFDTRDEFEKHDQGCFYSSCFPAQCCYCDEISENPRDYRKHYDTMHPDQQYRTVRHRGLCELCGKIVVKINHHLKEHAENPILDVNLNCIFCQARIQNPRSYVSHMLFNHTPKPYHCTECPAQFKYRCECRHHILKVHAPEMMFGCKPCGRRFSHIDFLQEHSLKAHNVDVKKKLKHSKRMKGKIYVYPHMKINGALIDTAVLDNITVEVCDYLDENNKPIDYKDSFVFDVPTEPIIYNMNNIPPKKPKVKKQVVKIESGEGNHGDDAKIKVKKEVKKEKSADRAKAKFNTNKNASNKPTILRGKRKIDHPEDVITKIPKYDFEADEIHNSLKFGITDYSYGKDNHIPDEKSEVEEEIVEEMGEISQDTGEEKYIDTKYEVIEEEDGQQYVLIDGVLYKLEHAD